MRRKWHVFTLHPTRSNYLSHSQRKDVANLKSRNWDRDVYFNRNPLDQRTLIVIVAGCEKLGW